MIIKSCAFYFALRRKNMTHYSKEQIEAADKGSILELADKVGIGLRKTGANEYKGVEHDSLVITPSKNAWYWNSEGKGGKGALSFAKEYALRDQNLDKKDRFLKAMEMVVKSNINEEELKEVKREPFKLDKKQFSKSFDKAESYLTNVRGLSPFLVEKLHQQGVIEQDKFGNALFMWRDPTTKEVKGITKQGTTINHKKYGKRGTLKNIEKNSEYGYGFSFDSLDIAQGKGAPENIRFFESSIDAMSYYNLNPKKLSNTRFVSMDGLKKEVVVNYLNATADELAKSGKALKSIAFGVDNDEAGTRFMKEMGQYSAKNNRGEVIKLKSAQPSKKYGKDWNDVLKNVRKMIKEKDIKVDQKKQNKARYIKRQKMAMQ